MNLALPVIVDRFILATKCKKVHLLARSTFVLFDFGNDYVTLMNFLQMQLSIDLITQSS